MAIGTARMAHLGLEGSELYTGIDFSEHPRVRELADLSGAMLLYPGEGAVAPGELTNPPSTLFVIDGTWPQARKVLRVNSRLQSLPRIGFVPQKPGNYRIRREPADHCLATVEAVVEVLSRLEGDSTRFQGLLTSFERMVDLQIARKAARTEPVRRRLQSAAPWWRARGMPNLVELWPRLIVVAAEANAHGRGSDVGGAPELIQLAAMRLGDGRVFHEFVVPRRLLGPSVPHHLGVPRELILGGRSVEVVMAEWDAFVGADGVLAGWGCFGWDLLTQERWTMRRPPIDLRRVMAHRLRRSPGTVLDAMGALGMGGIFGGGLATGRAGRTLSALTAVVGRLRAEMLGGVEQTGER